MPDQLSPQHLSSQVTLTPALPLRLRVRVCWELEGCTVQRSPVEKQYSKQEALSIHTMICHCENAMGLAEAWQNNLAQEVS